MKNKRMRPVSLTIRVSEAEYRAIQALARPDLTVSQVVRRGIRALSQEGAMPSPRAAQMGK